MYGTQHFQRYVTLAVIIRFNIILLSQLNNMNCVFNECITRKTYRFQRSAKQKELSSLLGKSRSGMSLEQEVNAQ
jgi:hypothetical protein